MHRALGEDMDHDLWKTIGSPFCSRMDEVNAGALSDAVEDSVRRQCRSPLARKLLWCIGATSSIGQSYGWVMEKLGEDLNQSLWEQMGVMRATQMAAYPLGIAVRHNLLYRLQQILLHNVDAINRGISSG